MSLLFAAIGATVAALLDVTIATDALFGTAHLHLLLVLTVAWAIAAGLDAGIVVAFVGGIVLDALTGRPFGVTVLALLLVAGVSAFAGQAMVRLRPVAAIVLTPVLSIAASLLIAGLSSAVAGNTVVGDAVSTFGTGALLDMAAAVVAGPLAVTIHERTLAEERVDW